MTNLQESGAALAALGWSPMFTDVTDLDVSGSYDACVSIEGMDSGSRDFGANGRRADGGEAAGSSGSGLPERDAPDLSCGGAF